MGFWTAVYPIIKESDVLLLVIDARTPEISDNQELERIAERFRKPVFIVYTKIDLVSEPNLRELRTSNRDAFFVSGNKNIGLKSLKVALLRYSKEINKIPLKVGVVGYPNVGKSSIINALAHRRHAPVSSVAGTTKGPQFIRVGDLKIIDSPGVIPYRDGEAKLGIINAKNPEKLRNPEKVAFAIIRFVVSKNKKAFEEYYGIEIEGDEYETLLAIGKKRGMLKKKGEIDEIRTALAVIRDWQTGKLRI